MTLAAHLGQAYEARVLSRGNYAQALSSFRNALAVNPHLRGQAMQECGRLETFLASIPGDQHKRCFVSVENLKTLKEALGVGQ